MKKNMKFIGTVILLVAAVFLFAGCDAVLETFYPEFAEDGGGTFTAKVALNLGDGIRSNLTYDEVFIAAVPFFETDFGPQAKWESAQVQSFNSLAYDKPEWAVDADIFAEFSLMRDRSYEILVWQEKSRDDGQPTLYQADGTIDEPSKILMVSYQDGEGNYRNEEKFFAGKDFPGEIQIHDYFDSFYFMDEGRYNEIFNNNTDSGSGNFMLNGPVNLDLGTVTTDWYYSENYWIERPASYNNKQIQSVNWTVYRNGMTFSGGSDQADVWDSYAQRIDFWIPFGQFSYNPIDFNYDSVEIGVTVRYTDGTVQDDMRMAVWFDTWSTTTDPNEAAQGTLFTIAPYIYGFPAQYTFQIYIYRSNGDMLGPYYGTLDSSGYFYTDNLLNGKLDYYAGDSYRDWIYVDIYDNVGNWYYSQSYPVYLDKYQTTFDFTVTP